jgi:hypothetical protein
MTGSTLTKIARFTWLLALACTLDRSGAELGLAGRAPPLVPPELADAGPDLYVIPDTYSLSSGDTSPGDQLGAVGPDVGADVPELPSSPTGKAYPQCPPRTALEACGNAGRADVAFGRTLDGFVCAACAPAVAVPCWSPPPDEVGPYGLCRRPWLCVPSCRRDCAELAGPTCAVVP